MPPDLLPSYSLGPLLGLAINGTLCLCCLVLGLMYPRYKPLKSLALFYGALVCFFSGFAAYGLQISPAWILSWYRLMLLGLAWLPFTWLMFCRDLRGQAPSALYYPCLAVALVATAALHLVDHPAVLGLPLQFHAHGGVWRPQSWLARPLIYVYVLVTNLAFIYLSCFRWWRTPPRPPFVAPMCWGLGIWLLMGVHDAALSVGYRVPGPWNLQWLGGLWFSMCQVAAVGLYFRDVLRASQRVQDELRHNKLRFQEVAEMSPSAIGECDTSLNLTFANRAALEMLGYHAADLDRGINLLDLAPAGRLEAGRRVLERLLANGAAGCEEVSLRRKDGRQINALVNFAPIVREGRVVGGRAAALDITERTRIAQALMRSEERYRTILEQMEDGYFETDLQGALTFCNDSLGRMLQYNREELSGMSYRQYMEPQLAARVLEECNQVYRTGRSQKSSDWRIITKSGQIRHVQSSISLRRDARGTVRGFRGVARDVTQSKLAEQDRQARLEAQLASQAKSQFLAKMSHEIRTPINAIMGMSELAAESGQDPIALGTYLEAISREASVLMSLVNDVLDFTKIEAGKLSLERVEFGPRDLVEGLASNFAHLARRNRVDLYCLVDPGLAARVLGDPGRLSQMLANLVMNALKFTAQGEIYLTVEAREGPHGGQLATFRVEDTGIGIARAKLESIFESFTQADASTTRRYGGSGLGLTIVKELAELMGGSIGVESQEGQGSVFWFQVPLAVPSGPRAAPWRPRAEPGSRVLLWHQSGRGGQAAEQYLRHLGWRVLRAASPGQVLALAGGCQAVVLGLAGAPLARGKLDPDFGEQLRARPLAPLLVLAPPGQTVGETALADLSPPGTVITQPLGLGDLARGLEQALGLTVGPARSPAPLASTVSQREQHLRPGLSVLVAEDYLSNRLMVQRHLTLAGCQVTVAEDGRQALEAFERQSFDLVLLDVEMPGLDGHAACRGMRALEARRAAAGGGASRVPVVAMTAHATQEHQRACLAAGMDDHLCKPFRRADLLAVVRKWTEAS